MRERHATSGRRKRAQAWWQGLPADVNERMRGDMRHPADVIKRRRGDMGYRPT